MMQLMQINLKDPGRYQRIKGNGLRKPLLSNKRDGSELIYISSIFVGLRYLTEIFGSLLPMRYWFMQNLYQLQLIFQCYQKHDESINILKYQSHNNFPMVNSNFESKSRAYGIQIIRKEYLYGAASNTIPFVVNASAIFSPYSEIHPTVEM